MNHMGFPVPFDILPFDEPAARENGKIRANLERIGMPIGNLDMLSGEHATSCGVSLVTNNGREFRRINGILVGDLD